MKKCPAPSHGLHPHVHHLACDTAGGIHMFLKQHYNMTSAYMKVVLELSCIGRVEYKLACSW